ncbi:unnamed protein product, partial [Phaeothamnion confervicola]
SASPDADDDALGNGASIRRTVTRKRRAPAPAGPAAGPEEIEEEDDGGNGGSGGGNSGNGGATNRVKTRTINKWTELEKSTFRTVFSNIGRDWNELATRIPTKTAIQIKNYYQNYRLKLNLDDLPDQRDGGAG